MSRRRVAIVYDAIYPFVKGGAERRAHELGIRLARESAEVHLYGMQFWEGPSVIERDGLVLHGIMRARPLYTPSGRRRIGQALLFGLSAFKLAREPFDVLDCGSFPYFSLFPARLITWLRRKPLYATWHEVWGRAYWREYLGPLGRAGYAVEWLAARLPDKIIAPSNYTARKLEAGLHVPAGKIQVVSNGIDAAGIARIKPAPEASDIIYTGRLMDFKRVDLVIRALARLAASGLRPSFTVIGDGPEAPKLGALADQMGVAGQIRWLGFIPDSTDVYAHMKASKVFVLPSRREGFGIVVLEANACGLPVLTPNFPANAASDLITEGENGSVVTGGVDLASKLEQYLALESPDLKSRCARSARPYDWDAIAGTYAGVYA